MSEQTRTALDRYLAALTHLCPTATSNYHVEPWLGHEQAYLVSIVPPQPDEAWLDLNEEMAAVATDLVVETGCLFVLTTSE